MKATLWALLRDEDGVGMAEFALVIALVTVVCIAGYKIIGNNIAPMLDPVNRELNQ